MCGHAPVIQRTNLESIDEVNEKHCLDEQHSWIAKWSVESAPVECCHPTEDGLWPYGRRKLARSAQQRLLQRPQRRHARSVVVARRRLLLQQLLRRCPLLRRRPPKKRKRSAVARRRERNVVNAGAASLRRGGARGSLRCPRTGRRARSCESSIRELATRSVDAATDDATHGVFETVVAAHAYVTRAVLPRPGAQLLE